MPLKKYFSRQSIKNILSGLVLSAITFALLFLVLEVILRVAKIQSDNLIMQDPVLGWTHIPNKEGYSRSKEFSVKVRLNKDGFIGRDYSYSKPENTTRILTIGDSLTEAFQVSEEKSYPRLLEENLKNNFKNNDFEVLNMGIAGYGTQREYYVLKDTGLKFNPDIAVFGFFTGNDFSDNMTESIDPETSFSRYRDIKNRVKLFARNHSVAWRFILRKKSKNKIPVYLLNKNTDDVAENLYSGKKNQDDDMQKKLDRSTGLLKSVKKLSDNNNVVLVIAILPSGGQVYGKNNNYGELENGLISFLEKEQMNYVDLLPYFKNWAKLNSDQVLYWPIDGHPNEHGHHVIATGVGEYLTNFLKKHGNF